MGAVIDIRLGDSGGSRPWTSLSLQEDQIFQALIDGSRIRQGEGPPYGAGDVLIFPSGVPHSIRNPRTARRARTGRSFSLLPMFSRMEAGVGLKREHDLHTGWPVNLLLGVLACTLQCQAAAGDSWSCSYSAPEIHPEFAVQFRLNDGVLIGNYPRRPDHTWPHQTTFLPDGVIRGKDNEPIFLSNFIRGAPPLPVVTEVTIDRITGRSEWSLWVWQLDKLVYHASGLCRKD